MEKYSSVIIERSDLEEFLDNLDILTSAFSNKNFIEIINSASISKDKKIYFIMSFCKHNTIAFQNFIQLLFLNKSICKIPSIYKAILKKVSLKKDEYEAIIYTQNHLNTEEIKSYEEKLSNKFGKNIKLKNLCIDKKEIRIYIEDLGYEIIVSSDVLKQKLKQHIIKAI